jgi:RND family efflux transporter MFP subunit
MKKSLIRIVAALSLGAGILVFVQSCTESQGKSSSIPKSSEPIPVKVKAIGKSETASTIATSGRLTTDDETILSFKTAGVVNAVYVKEGQKVSKGQLLATLDLTEINSLVAQSRSGLEKAERDFARAENLYKDSVATLEQLQNASTALELAKQQYNAALFNKNYSQIKAPANGYVLRKFVNAGQVVGVGDPILRTNGAGDGRWILQSGVSDRQWSTIRVSDKVTLKIDAFPGRNFNGTVIRKSETADPATGSFMIEIAVDKNEARLASGMFASATVYSSEKTTGWSVPYEAVLDANGNEGFVFVSNDGKTALKRPVVVESFNGTSVQVSAGLEGDQNIIVSGSAYLTDKSPITVIK